MKEIVLASSNKGKIKEFREIFANIGVNITPQSELSINDADETGLSFIENAIIKARHCSEHSRLPAIADDSGLEVSSLNGQPGIYSARYAGEHGNDTKNISKLLENLMGSNDRDARFVCAIAYVKHHDDPTPIISVGHLRGTITTKAEGINGFGYDPVFFVKNLNKTLAEMSSEQKNEISHRSQALTDIIKQISRYK